MKVFVDVIKKMKQLEVLFPGQGADDDVAHDATSLGSGGSSSGPPDASELLDTIWVSGVRKYTSGCRALLAEYK